VLHIKHYIYITFQSVTYKILYGSQMCLKYLHLAFILLLISKIHR